MSDGAGQVHLSASTWQQPLPATTSPERVAVLDRVAARVLGTGAGRVRVGIDGRTAAGKTTFGHELAHRVSRAGRPVLRASLDDFKKPWADRHRYDRTSGEGYYRNAFDYPALTRLLLRPAGVDGSGGCALCSIDPLTQLDQSRVITHAASDAVLIVDGVFAFRPEIDACWDLRIWLHVDEELSAQRGERRDGADGGSVHRSRYLPAERVYLKEVDPVRRADLVIDNSAFDRPRILPRG